MHWDDLSLLAGRVALEHVGQLLARLLCWGSVSKWVGELLGHTLHHTHVGVQAPYRLLCSYLAPPIWGATRVMSNTGGLG